jgi:hypothetical protein
VKRRVGMMVGFIVGWLLGGFEVVGGCEKWEGLEE